MKKFFKRLLYTLLILFVLINVLVAIQAYHATHFYQPGPSNKHVNEMNTGEKISASLFGVQAHKQVVVDSLKPPHQTFTLTTEDSLTLAAWYISDTIKYNTGNGRLSKGTVIMFHGHAASRSSIIPEAEAFDNMGYTVLMIDFRAHGLSAGNECTIGYKEAKDVKAAYDYIAAKGEKNIILYGISLGASTIIKAIHDYDEIKPSKIILEMPFATLQDATEGMLRNNGLPAEPLAGMLSFWGSVEHGFWTFAMKPEEYAKSIQCPVLMQRGTADIRVTQQETMDIYNNIPSPDKTLVEYAGLPHGSLYKKQPEKWLQSVTTFLNK